MTVYFIGVGSGAADLLTLRAGWLIRSCPVCLYAGSTISPKVLENCSEGAEIINTTRMPSDTIIETVQAARVAGKGVTHLQPGDPSVWSALTKQVHRLNELGINYEIIPGMLIFSTAAAALGHEFTVPTVDQSVVLIRISGYASKMPESETLENFGRTGATLCIHSTTHDIDCVVEEFTLHHGERGPVVVVVFASHPKQVILRDTLSDITQQVKDAGVTRTAVITIGKVLTVEVFPDNYLYGDDRPRDEHGRITPYVH